MSKIALTQLEKKIEALPADEQLLLISRVAEKLRGNAEREFEFESQLAKMAADEQIQAELRNIEHDFAFTELDGLA